MAKGGARFAIDQTISVAGEAPVSLPGSGLVDPEAMRGRMQIDLSQFPDLPSAFGADPGLEVVFERLTIYMRSAAFAAILPGAKRWLKLDVEKAGKTAGIDLGALAQQGQDPTQTLRYLKAASGAVERVGEEDVRGVKTTGYKATIDLRRYPELVPAKDRAPARAAIEQVIELLGTDKAPVEVWIGEDGIVRRLKQKVSAPIPPGRERSTIEQQVDFFDFGTPVDVRLPPADEVQDATDLVAAGLRGLTR